MPWSVYTTTLRKLKMNTCAEWTRWGHKIKKKKYGSLFMLLKNCISDACISHCSLPQKFDQKQCQHQSFKPNSLAFSYESLLKMVLRPYHDIKEYKNTCSISCARPWFSMFPVKKRCRKFLNSATLITRTGHVLVWPILCAFHQPRNFLYTDVSLPYNFDLVF